MISMILISVNYSRSRDERSMSLEHPTFYRAVQERVCQSFTARLAQERPTILLLHGLPSSSRMF